ncbi:MAG TPA: lysophospholipid acyltransferase family protein [Verrucomicrobiae bacterium]|nr:lysophospholipid acyltransferase family protein [Verrucomicrobiae bacterium]
MSHRVRAALRLLWLTGELLAAAAKILLQNAGSRKHSALAMRTLWLHQSARRLAAVFHLQPRMAGTLPPSGLLICNHLSYLDIVLLAALTPAVFVAKRDVKHWPVFGWFARQGGTIFIDRQRRSDVGRVNCEIASALDAGALVILFPEGTSSGGDRVLPFKSSLLEPAAASRRPISVGAISYRVDDGDAAEEVCYWKDHTLVPHLFNLLGKGEIRATVRFSRVRGASSDRKELARQLHLEISALRTPKPPTPKPAPSPRLPRAVTVGHLD